MLDDRREFPAAEPIYSGLRMSTDEYEQLVDDGHRYEVIDGVVIMAPSPGEVHQDVLGEIECQIRVFLDDNPIGRVLHDIDVRFDAKTLYRPDLIFLSKASHPKRTGKIHVVPNMILEILSPGTRQRDLNTKKDDYERFGVHEYWILDTENGQFTCFRQRAGKFRGSSVSGRSFLSQAIPNFRLDLAAVRRVIRG